MYEAPPHLTLAVDRDETIVLGVCLLQTDPDGERLDPDLWEELPPGIEVNTYNYKRRLIKVSANDVGFTVKESVGWRPKGGIWTDLRGWCLVFEDSDEVCFIMVGPPFELHPSDSYTVQIRIEVGASV